MILMKRLIISTIIITVISFGAFFWWTSGLKAINSQNKTQKIFVIQKGQNVREIANSLKKQGLIKDPIVFFLLVKQLGLDGKIQAGDFRLSPSMDAKTLAENLTHGTLDIWVTVPEGKRTEEVGEILKQSLSTYQESWNKELTQHEGYLFPDSYLIPRDADIQMIITQMKKNFDQKYQELNNQYTSSLPEEEVVILASLVEREAKLDQDRPLVASVLLNRRRIGMALQVDATVQYALGYQPQEKNWWKRHLTREDLDLNSPYNTYDHPGLPPTPIANPGYKALEAIFTAPKTNYIYYISDKTGKNHYAKTFEEHRSNIEKYGL